MKLGTAGGVRSTVKLSGAEASLRLPAASIETAVTVCTPADSPESVTLVNPVDGTSAASRPSRVTSTVTAGGAIMTTPTLVSRVRPSSADCPVWLAASNCSCEGACGVAVSSVRCTWTVEDVLPYSSTTLIATTWSPSGSAPP